MLARAGGQPVGEWLTNLIANAPDNVSDTTDESDRSANASDIAALTTRLERLEHAVFPPDKSSASDTLDILDMRGLPEKLAEARRDRTRSNQ